MKSFFLKKIKVLNINFESQRPAAHGVLRWILEFIGGRFLIYLLFFILRIGIFYLLCTHLPLVVAITEVESSTVPVIIEVQESLPPSELEITPWSYYLVRGAGIAVCCWCGYVLVGAVITSTAVGSLSGVASSQVTTLAVIPKAIVGVIPCSSAVLKATVVKAAGTTAGIGIPAVGYWSKGEYDAVMLGHICDFLVWSRTLDLARSEYTSWNILSQTFKLYVEIFQVCCTNPIFWSRPDVAELIGWINVYLIHIWSTVYTRGDPSWAMSVGTSVSKYGNLTTTIEAAIYTKSAVKALALLVSVKVSIHPYEMDWWM